MIRPEDIMLSSEKSANTTAGKISQLQFEGSTTRLRVESAEKTFTVVSLRADFHPEQVIWLHFPPERLHIFPKVKAS